MMLDISFLKKNLATTSERAVQSSSTLGLHTPRRVLHALTRGYPTNVLSRVERYFYLQGITARKEVREYYARLPQLRSEASGDVLLV